jgi:hypothetical protein
MQAGGPRRMCGVASGGAWFTPSAYATFAIFSRQEYRTATREDAKCDPEKYDLLRAQGGWTEFFVTMFPARQTQHGRRPVESAEAHE